MTALPRPSCRALCAGLAVALLAATAAGQGTTRQATTAQMLVGFPGFFHGRTVVVHQRVVDERDLTRLADAPKPVYVYWRNSPSGTEGEIRGEFWDLGRMDRGDGRLAGYDFTSLLDTVTRGEWPRRGEVYVLLGATLLPAMAQRAPTVRAIALEPQRFADRDVTVIGRFKGRNLYGELPTALAKGKWDFVIQSADAALWVTGVRPRGKGFDLDPERRVDTGRWVQVTGVVKHEAGMPYIHASAIALATEPEDAPVEVELPAAPPQPAPEVIFSAPLQNDDGIERAAPVRIQFSRDMDPRTVRGRVRVSYADPQLKAPDFTVAYNDGARAIEIRFAEPLERFQQVNVELLAGMTALDGQPLAPWTLTFTTGGKER